MTTLGDIGEYKLVSYINGMFDDWPAELIEYKAHVRPEFKTLKTDTVDRDDKHRPVIKKFYIDGVKVMEHYWTFTLDEDGFIVTRKMERALTKMDGTMSDKFTVEYDVYDKDNATHLHKVMKERADSRRFVISNLKGQIMYILGLLHPEEDLLTIQNWGASFFYTHNAAISSYYEANNSLFVSAVVADTEHTWLDDVPQPGLTLRTMIIGAVQ